MTITPPGRVERMRLSALERRAAILACASRLLLSQGYFPLPFEELGRLASVSKALIYAYFKSQHELADAMLATTISGFRSAALDRVLAQGDSVAIIGSGADMYFDVVAEHGPILHLLLNDPYLAGSLDRDLTDYIAACRRRAVMALCDLPGLQPREAAAALELFLAIVEDAGRAAFRGEMDKSLARRLGKELVLSGLAGLGPAGPGSTHLPLAP